MHVEPSDPAPYPLRIDSSVSPFPLSPDFVVIALARRCITRCVRFPFVLCFLRVPVCIRPFSSPRVFVCVPCRTCRAFSFVFIPFPRVCIAFPCAFLPIEPACPEYFHLRSHALRQRREPVRTRTVFHLPSPLPLSRDAFQLVTCTCRVQSGCSGHHTPILHIHIHSCRGQLTI